MNLEKKVMKCKASDLIFISQIKRDGSGVSKRFDREYLAACDEEFRMSCLSLSEKTFIAVNFNTYVVKLKSEK
jgi:hypothetical protein